MDGYNLLDSSAFDEFMESKSSFKKRYADIQKKYSDITKSLAEMMDGRYNWQGSGAKAFKQDAEIVSSNLLGISEILNTMCDTLSDCYEIFSECDQSLGKNNREAIEQ